MNVRWHRGNKKSCQLYRLCLKTATSKSSVFCPYRVSKLELMLEKIFPIPDSILQVTSWGVFNYFPFFIELWSEVYGLGDRVNRNRQKIRGLSADYVEHWAPLSLLLIRRPCTGARFLLFTALLNPMRFQMGLYSVCEIKTWHCFILMRLNKMRLQNFICI